MNKMNRRSFLQTSLAASAALSLPARLRAAADGANGDIRVAVVGFNGRGQNHISSYLGLKEKGVRIVALCDVNSKNNDAAAKKFPLLIPSPTSLARETM